MSVPAELRDLAQWVVWRYEDRDGKRTKVPYQPAALTARASSTDPGTWGTHEDALRAAGTDGMDGTGFVFTAEDPYSGVDFDHCVNGEDVNPHAANVLRELDSYAEFSPSGTGLHVIVCATVNGGKNRTSKTPWGAEFENYDRGRFFCMTGRHVPDTPRTVNERQRQLDAVRAKMFPPQEKPAAQHAAPAADDRDLLALAGHAKNGADFDALYRGQHSYGSASEADLALCNLLAFWFGPDPAAIDRAFRGSGLMRPKWDTTRGETTYGAQTIETALAGRTEFYGTDRHPGGGGRNLPPNQNEPSDQGGDTFTRASAIKPRRIRWAWQGRLALGYLSLWSGESSLGKSTHACSLITDLSHGRLEGHLEGKPASVLVVASEDAREDMWVPRLMAAGADLDRVQFQNQTRDWNLRDGMKLTETALDRGEAKFVLIDSVLEHMPDPKSGENINQPTFIRRSLGNFADLCKARHVAGLVSTHPPKSKGSTFADSVISSAAFVHMTRVGLLFAWHPADLELPDQERRRVLMRPPGGSNIGRDPGCFEFSIGIKELLIEGELEEVPYTTPLIPSDVSYRDLTRTVVGEGPARPKIADAKQLIDERLADGEWHPSMIDELIRMGFAKTTVYEASEDCVKHKPAFDGSWWWACPGTSKSSFVEVARNPGPSARAGGTSRIPDLRGKDPKTPTNTPRSEVPGELDENGSQHSVADEGPNPEVLRAYARGNQPSGPLAQRIMDRGRRL
jgi:hypothetical protein